MKCTLLSDPKENPVILLGFRLRQMSTQTCHSVSNITQNIDTNVCWYGKRQNVSIVIIIKILLGLNQESSSMEQQLPSMHKALDPITSNENYMPFT